MRNRKVSNSATVTDKAHGCRSTALAAVYNGIDDTQFGFGLRSTLGLEVMVSGKVGIGIEGVSQRHFFKKPDNFNLPDDEFYGFQQLGILFGLRIYH